MKSALKKVVPLGFLSCIRKMMFDNVNMQLFIYAMKYRFTPRNLIIFINNIQIFLAYESAIYATLLFLLYKQKKKETLIHSNRICKSSTTTIIPTRTTTKTTTTTTILSSPRRLGKMASSRAAGNAADDACFRRGNMR